MGGGERPGKTARWLNWFHKGGQTAPNLSFRDYFESHALQPDGIVDLLFEKSLVLKIFEIYTTAWRSSRNLLLVLLTPPLRCAP